MKAKLQQAIANYTSSDTMCSPRPNGSRRHVYPVQLSRTELETHVRFITILTHQSIKYMDSGCASFWAKTIAGTQKLHHMAGHLIINRIKTVIVPEDSCSGVVDKKCEHKARPDEKHSVWIKLRQRPAGLHTAHIVTADIVELAERGAVRQHANRECDHVDDVYEHQRAVQPPVLLPVVLYQLAEWTDVKYLCC